MIEIVADTLYYNGKPVGFVTVPNGSLRADFEFHLNDLQAVYDATGELESTLRDKIAAIDSLLDQVKEEIAY